MSVPSFLQRILRPFSSGTAALNPGSNAGPMLNPEGTEVCIVAAGCFWGVEHMYRRAFKGKGLIDARVGYVRDQKTDDNAPTVAEPNYRLVCSGSTGYAEALKVTFDPKVVTYRELLEFFYKMHDPTTSNQQGPDRGTQYRSAIFIHNKVDSSQTTDAQKTDEQKELEQKTNEELKPKAIEHRKIADEVTAKVQEQWFKGRKVVTEVQPAGKWWNAEDYHQLYLDKNPSGYECPSHFLRNFPPLS